ncbi:MAG: phospholipase D-like domain-containing protein [Methanomicrobiaceae archaeon]|nr:phospholipase D-like domain-containing protein [Methanomicrobiaceae archaeon]
MRSLLPIAVLLLIFTSPVHGSVVLTEFCPDTYLAGEGDEYFVLTGEGDLSGIRITDGEGSVRFPGGVAMKGDITVAREGTAFVKVHGYFPDYEIYDTDPEIPDMIRGGNFRLRNDGDELSILLGTEIVQRVTWPGDVEMREGQIHLLRSGVWDPRPLFIGQSRFFPETFGNVTVTCFVSPDCSQEVILQAIDGAEREILANVYEFTDAAIARSLAGASLRGIQTEVLLEGGPVGGIAADEQYIVGILSEAGVGMYQMTTTEEAHAKYRFNHAKYLVIDDDTVLVTSENFKESGFPPAGYAGNRGWGVVLRDPELAAYFSRVYAHDRGGGDIVPLPGGGEPKPHTPESTYRVEFAPRIFTGAEVTPVLSPDTSDLVRELIEGAASTVDIEQAYIRNWSGGMQNPYVAAAINASRRGVVVRVLLDASWFNIYEEEDNDEMATYLNHIARNEQIPLEARVAALEEMGVESIHNKGVIVDGKWVLVSSINWNEHSPSFNREAGVIIEHPGVGQYYTAVFEDDWDVRPSGSIGGYGEKIAAAAGIIIVLLLIYIRRDRR